MAQNGTQSKRARTALGGLEMDEARYVALLRNLIGVSERLQNNPAQDLYPREDLASDFVLEQLNPYTKEAGGPLEVERLSFQEGRGNVVITYPGATAESVAFVGSHLDVVPANPENWERDPFSLSVEGDKLYGRGTTDCLGHVALVTELMIQLAIARPALRRTVTAVLICNEENGVVEGISVERLMETGRLDAIKSGPVYWIDVAESQPCIGTAGSLTWHLKAVGKAFHSGLPHKGINALELVNAAVSELQTRFYKAVPAHAQEKTYSFATPSTLKPTQCKVAPGSLNQVPAWAEIAGDIRLTPFYDVEETRALVEGMVADMNANLGALQTWGPASRYQVQGVDGEALAGKLELRWGEGAMEGIACKLDTEGHRALVAATATVQGEAKPYSICGSLPLVRNLQRGGLDVQMTGFGLVAVYHADNEYCLLSHMKKGLQVLLNCIINLE